MGILSEITKKIMGLNSKGVVVPFFPQFSTLSCEN